MGFCSTLSGAILVFASVIYLFLGVGITAAAIATFFTSWGEVITPIYAGSSIGVGVGIFLLALVGFKAACATKRKGCLLGIFMIFDLLLVAVIGLCAFLMFRWDGVLEIASRANVDGDITAGADALDQVGMGVVKTLVTKAWDACGGVATQNFDDTFSFVCNNDGFEQMQTSVNLCMSSQAFNASLATPFYACYTGQHWEQEPAMTSSNAADVVNTPKGAFCTCSSALLAFFLDHVEPAKYIAIGVGVFLLLIFLACCYLCCCDKARPEAEEYSGQIDLQAQNPNAGYNVNYGGTQPVVPKGRGYQASDGQYIGR